MFSSVNGMCINGLKAHLIRVEVDVSTGLPCFDIVGLAAPMVREARERVRSALRNSGFEFPLKRVTVNLAPANLRKMGSGLDLPIALGILTATGQLGECLCENGVFVGELSLEGAIRGVPGILAMAGLVGDDQIFIVPPDNLAEARLMKGVKSKSTPTLSELVQALNGEGAFLEQGAEEEYVNISSHFIDFKEIRGQYQTKRALEIGAAGGHNLILVGPPGSGKTMLARAYAGILPLLSEQESIEVTQLYSLAGLFKEQGALIRERPFRHPHHTASLAGILGGGRELRPGEISLANHGVLFMDELPEFSREVLESLRQPLEDRKITLTRQKGSVDFPARVSVIASMNPCPCGFLTDQGGRCNCSPRQIQDYRKKISGPVLDRFDLHVDVPRLSYKELRGDRDDVGSEEIRERVVKARRCQWERLGEGRTNAEMNSEETKTYSELSRAGEQLMERVFEQKQLSGRAYDRILKVGRTIADLAESDAVLPVHIAEAIQYRVLDQA